MGVHDIERHLYRIEMKLIFCRHIEHSQVNEWILVSGKTDVADFPCFSGLQHRFLSSAFAKDAVGVLGTNHFVMLEEINVVGLQSLQRIVQLTCRFFFGPTIDFCHQKDFLTVDLPKSLTHPNFALAVVVVPAIVQKGDSAINRTADDFDAVRFGQLRFADMVSAQTDDGYFFSGASEGAIEHVAAARFDWPLLSNRFGRGLSSRSSDRSEYALTSGNSEN